MKKRFMKFVCAALAACLCVPVTACMGGSENYDNVLLISVQNVGNGYRWAEEIAAAFTRDTGIETRVRPTSVTTYIDTTLPSGPKNNPVDIYFTNGSYYSALASGRNYIKGYDYEQPMLDISDVYERYAEGYTDANGQPVQIKIKDLLAPQAVQYNVYDKDGKFYFIEYANNLAGIIYHKDKFAAYGLTEPRTTDELVELCAEVKRRADIPEYSFVYCGQNGYWRYVTNVWWAQYEGIEKFQQFYEGKYDGSYAEGWRNYAAQGRKEALDVFTDLCRYENGYADPQSVSYTFTQGQLKFLEGSGLMCVSGDWIEREMESNFSSDEVDLGLMRAPIVSAILDVLPDRTITTDQELRAVVDYVDGVTDTVDARFSAADIERVRDARKVVMFDSGSGIFIPVYSDMAEQAKDFIAYYYNKASQELLLQYSRTITAPLNQDYPIDYFDAFDGLSNFQKEKKRITENGYTYAGRPNNIAIMYTANLQEYYANGSKMDSVIGLNPAQTSSRMTGEEIFNASLAYYSNRTTWNNILKNAGLDRE